jgi:carboxypeptidase family protein
VTKFLGLRRFLVRLGKLSLLVSLALWLVGSAGAQTPNGAISGLVLDPTGAVIAGADITIVNDATGVQYFGKSNEEGVYVVRNLPPGPYRLQVGKTGFKTIIKPDVVLNVEDALAINFTLPIGAASETVTVIGGAPLINTESGSVSTVVDRNFVENLPLNGRSFNTLLALTPGVVIAPSNASDQGQFSVAGQRTSANNFIIDGVSANFGVSPEFGLGTSGTGGAQAFSAVGGTSSLASVEALEEFRIETSSFAPEFGRSPGGQVILTTRSGTDAFHGGLYEYFRNDALDANDWFANRAHKARAPERHNDFGGFLGGPIQTDKTFFFLSYEAARLRQPNTQIVEVPSEYARGTAPAQLAPFIDAYPQPDDRSVVNGVYAGAFTGSFSNPATLNAGSIRIDHTLNSKVAFFGRYNEAPSETAQRTQSLNELDTSNVGTRTITVGTTIAFNPQISDNGRANYSEQRSGFSSALDSFGGASPPNPSVLGPGLANPGSALLAFETFDTGFYELGPVAKNRSTQLEFADDLGITVGSHQLKFGGDYRTILLDLRPYQSVLLYEASSVSALFSTGQALALVGDSTKPSSFLSQATSIYAQDSWKTRQRLTLTYGVRWELAPAPSGRKNTTLASWTNVSNPADLGLAPFGTPLWNTTYTNFAPRIGAAYALSKSGDLVLRGGTGIFYDLGADSAGYLGFYFPNFLTQTTLNVPLPISGPAAYLPTVSLLPPYPNAAHGFSPDLKLPRSYQWNIALEKAFAGQQALSLTYVGQAGRELLRQEGLAKPNANFAGSFVLTQNNARSNYNALQVQYRRMVSKRLQVLANYTWSHSLDNASNDVIETVSSAVVSAARDYASSDFDVRKSFSGAVTYDLPRAGGGRLLRAISGDWSLKAAVVARNGFPFNALALTSTISGAYPRPNLVAGEPLYVSGSQCQAVFATQCPGGKALNPAAFSTPSSGQQGSEGRNDIAGFGLTQMDFSVSRKFPITERAAVLFQSDAFNLLNHPNFTNPIGYYLSPTFTTYLQSSEMLNKGLGGLNPLFQQGGPRSLQLSLKLTF